MVGYVKIMNMDPKVNTTGAQWLYALWNDDKLMFHIKSVCVGAATLGLIAGIIGGAIYLGNRNPLALGITVACIAGFFVSWGIGAMIVITWFPSKRKR